jgi:Zn-dependent peptidase ImmA (M78 family)/transcriptional regulator with XRE-family HTH domain
MTMGVQTFRGERLKEARLARGLFKNALGSMVGVSGTAITRYEENQDKPQRDRLEAIAAHLGFPVDYFLRPGWAEPIEGIFWRTRTSETKSAREMTEQRMRWLCEIFSFLEQDVDFPPQQLPDVDVPADFRLITPEQIEQVAEEVRRAWSLRIGPIPDVILALENAGVPVVTLDIASDKQDGFFFESPALRRCFVGINTYQVSAARARFDAAHELGHAILHSKNGAHRAQDSVSHKIKEQQAHRFAGAFLFPRPSFMSEVGVPSLDYFCSLKKRWGMSIGAMIFRAFDLGIIDEFEKASLFQNMGRRRWRGALREPFDAPSDMPLERPRMLRRAFEAVVAGGLFGRATFAQALMLPEREVEQIVGLDQGFLRAVPAEIVRLAERKAPTTARTAELEAGDVVIDFPGQRVR